MALFKKKNKTPLGIYIHVPFCRSKCQYCDFYSLPSKDDGVMDAYMHAVCRHIKEAGALAPNHLVDTVYFGGGTPSFFGADGMATILTAVRKNFDVALDAEITFEANPDSVTLKLLRRLRAEGFNRVGLGIQSDDDELLRKLGRAHTYQQAVQAVQRIRQAGFRNLSVDLMYGLPGQSLMAWEQTVEHVLTLRPEHISCYGLKIEPGTPMHDYKDYLQLPGDDVQADMYLSMVRILEDRGYGQYEISNFAKKGYESKHNLKYWNGGEYLGFGPDASSDFGGKRFSIIRDVRGYCSAIKAGSKVITDIQEVPPRERAGEYLMMRLRTTAGIGAEEYEKRYLLPFAPLEAILRENAKHGLAREKNGRWAFTPQGFLVSNSIISDLLVAQDRSNPLAKRRM